MKNSYRTTPGFRQFGNQRGQLEEEEEDMMGETELPRVFRTP